MSTADKEKTADISRREFIRRMTMLGALASSYPAAALTELRRSKSQQTISDEDACWQQAPAWQTLAQVQAILFPAGEDIPGAGDIGAIVYLHTAIENPDADGEDKAFIFRGLGWLDGLTEERFNKTFLQLSLKQQEEIITSIVKSRAGRNWVSTLLTYLLEALLSAPVYGGNKNESGWQWLEHQPGYPLPATDKTWDKLLQRRYKA